MKTEAIEIYSGHCKADSFFNKMDSLQSLGFIVQMDGVFKNTIGEQFVQFIYYIPSAHNERVVVKRSASQHPRINQIGKENLHDPVDPTNGCQGLNRDYAKINLKD